MTQALRVTVAARSRLALDDRREQLLELGLRLFGTRAYDEVSIDDIAAEAGISKGLLYHYFGSKRAFYLATIDVAAGKLLTALTSVDPTLPGPAKARAGLVAYLDFVEERAEAYAALVTGGLGADPEVARVLEMTRAAIVADILNGLGLTEARPVFALAMRTFIGGVEAAALQWLANRHVERATLVTFLTAHMEHTLALAISLDPEAGVVLDRPPGTPK